MKQLALFMVVIIMFPGCYETDTSTSLLGNEFQRCRLLTETIDGRLTRKVNYQGKQIRDVEFYNTNGTVSVIKVYSYKNDNIIKIEDSINILVYEYDNKSLLLSEVNTNKISGIRCTTLYNNQMGTCSVDSYRRECTNGDFREYYYYYLNKYDCSHMRSAYNRQDNIVENENRLVLKMENVINPFVEVIPNQEYYFNEIVRVGSIDTSYEILLLNNSWYPLLVSQNLGKGVFRNIEYTYICD